MTKTEVTKRVVLNAIVDVANLMTEPVDVDGVEVTPADIVAYAEKTIAQLDNKNAKAQERAAKKKAEGDELRDAIEGVLTEEGQTIAQILAALDNDDLTPAKVVARLTALVKLGKVEKTDVKDEASGRKLKAYALVSAE